MTIPDLVIEGLAQALVETEEECLDSIQDAAVWRDLFLASLSVLGELLTAHEVLKGRLKSSDERIRQLMGIEIVPEERRAQPRGDS